MTAATRQIHCLSWGHERPVMFKTKNTPFRQCIGGVVTPPYDHIQYIRAKERYDFMDKQAIADLAGRVMERLFVEMEASGRHVHLTEEQIQRLFGHGLTPAKPLSQPGQFAAKERLTLAGPKGELQNVAVLGPARKEGQVELSLTDARTLGLTVPVRLSGDVADSPGLTLIGPRDQVELKQGAIAARRHIHLRPADAARFGVEDKQVVKLRTFTSRPLVFDDVVVRVSPDFAPRVHLDYDEANACGFAPGDYGRIIP